MKHPSKVRRVTRSLMALFVTKQHTTTFITHKDQYYKHFWLNKSLSGGIEKVAEIEQTSKKEAAELLLRAGLSSYMGEKIAQYIKDERAAREHGQKVKMTRFIIALRRYAKAQGMDISKII